MCPVPGYSKTFLAWYGTNTGGGIRYLISQFIRKGIKGEENGVLYVTNNMTMTMTMTMKWELQPFLF